MAMEALCSSNDLFNFVIYDTISATPCRSFENDVVSLETTVTTTTTTRSPYDNIFLNHDDHILLFDHRDHHQHHHQVFLNGGDSVAITTQHGDKEQLQRSNVYNSKLGVVGPTSGGVNNSSNKKKKRRRKARVCKNKEEAENQRMTHIAVERNRRKQMNEHLAVLRSLMPDSYVQRGDQASIVGGAIEFVKELEHLLQSLEVKKLEKNLQAINNNNNNSNNNNNNNNNNNIGGISKILHDDQENAMEMRMSSKLSPPPFSQFFVYPQYTWSQPSSKYTSKTKAAIADIEVTLIETHANIRILSRRSLRQLSKLVAGFNTLHLTVLHLSVTTMDPLVLYSVSVKVEEECLLTSVDDIASAINHILRIIEEEAALC